MLDAHQDEEVAPINSIRQRRKRSHLDAIIAREEATRQRNTLHRAVRKSVTSQAALSAQESAALAETSPEVIQQISDSILGAAVKRERYRQRRQEVIEPMDQLELKCAQLCRLLSASKNTVVYTGAGISTAANIPDYRGPQGIWSQNCAAAAGGSGPAVPRFSLPQAGQARPTFTHMLLAALVRASLVSHIVSQNCDGLHLRSGLPVDKLSELHGNIFVEVCSSCEALILRQHDVTERSSARRHRTGRLCPRRDCHSGHLLDTVVHFGENGRIETRDRLYEWRRAEYAAANADLILCLGSSLKVLKEYRTLWPRRRRSGCGPQLVIVNLQWTPKDATATLKINATCDEVSLRLSHLLQVPVEPYCITKDPLLRHAEPFSASEMLDISREAVQLSSEETERLEQLLAQQQSRENLYAAVSDFERPSNDSPGEAKLEEDVNCSAPSTVLLLT